MRKGLMFLLGIVSFLGINTVSADEIYLNYEENINEIKTYINKIGYDSLNNAINEIIKYYDDNLSEEHPYYFISLYYHGVYNKFMVVLTPLSSNYADEYYYNFDQSGDSSYLINNGYMNDSYYQYYYDFTDNTIKSYGFYNNDFDLFTVDFDTNPYYPYNYYYSNFDFYYKGTLLGESTLTDLSPSDTLYFPLLNDSTKYSVHNANTDFLIEPYYLYDDNDSFKVETDNFIEIDLNEYPYVALSLKDYTARDTFYTNMYVQGQLCLTPVYNYGMTEKTDIVSGSKNQRCSIYYDESTLVRTYILDQDIENNAIYYLKAYDTSKTNIVKIDTSVFDVTYITEDTQDNPYVSISGKTYPTIAYDNLTDTATKSEDEDYISGVSCQVGDFNCYNEYNPGNIFDEIFSSPLELLKDIWSSVTSIFTLIGEFISLLPQPMQSFLYLSFMVAIVLGLLKIIL